MPYLGILKNVTVYYLTLSITLTKNTVLIGVETADRWNRIGLSANDKCICEALACRVTRCRVRLCYIKIDKVQSVWKSNDFRRVREKIL